MDRSIGLSVVAALVAFVPVSAYATIHYVPSQYATIQAGIDVASGGDTILVADGTYTGTGNRDIDLLGKDIVVVSENGASVTTIDCQSDSLNPHRAFVFQNQEDSTAVVSGFTIVNGFAPLTLNVADIDAWLGGGILCRDTSSPTIANCIFNSNVAGWPSSDSLVGGGAIEIISHSSPKLVSCDFTGNASRWGAAVEVYDSSGATIQDCDFASNVASDSTQAAGGAVAVWPGCNLKMSGCSFDSNVVYSGTNSGFGGAIVLQQSVAAIDSCTFTANQATFLVDSNLSHGGAIFALSSDVTIAHSQFMENSSSYVGGAISAQETNMQLDSCDFLGNTAPNGAGGAIVAFQNMGNPIFTEISSSTFWANSGEKGGALCAVRCSSLVIVNVTMAQNSVDSGGSAIRTVDCAAVIDRTVLAYNTGGDAIVCVNTTKSEIPQIYPMMSEGLTAKLGSDLRAVDNSRDSEAVGDSVVVISCSDIYGNEGGDWTGSIADQQSIRGNMSYNPLFCDTSSGNLAIDSASFCAPANSVCELVGACEPNCSGCNDLDSDGYCYDVDNCPEISNSSQTDSDNDGVGDPCDICPGNDDSADSDTDFHPDSCDNCPELSNIYQEDTDADNVGDSCDNCPEVSNVLQEDDDSDGVGDLCDNCPDHYNPYQEDADSNGVGDVCDFVCGNVDGDPSSVIDINDLLYFRGYLYAGGPSPVPLGAADLDALVGVTNNDYMALMDHLFVNFNALECNPLPDTTFPYSDDDTIQIRAFIVPPGNSQWAVEVWTALSVPCHGLSFPFSFSCATSAISLDSIVFTQPLDLSTSIVDNGLGSGVIGICRMSEPVPAGEQLVAELHVSLSNSPEQQVIVIDTAAYDRHNHAILSRLGVGVTGLIPQVTSSLVDTDGDDVADYMDNCPLVFNPLQEDTDIDNAGDSCDLCPGYDDGQDADGDSVPDSCDACPGYDDLSDYDGDGVADGCDICPSHYDPLQGDGDLDAVGDSCDNCPGFANADQEDADGDGEGDVCDSCTDTDGDGYGDPGYVQNTCTEDNCPDVYNPGQEDADEDGVGDVCDYNYIKISALDAEDVTGIADSNVAIQIWAFGDDTITGGTVPLHWDSDPPNSTYFHLDSVIFGPLTGSWGFHEYFDDNDTTSVICLAFPPGDTPLPPGELHLWAEVWLGLVTSEWDVGDTFTVDTASFAGNTFTLVLSGGQEITPSFGGPLYLFPADPDSDGVASVWDNCPDDYNPGQEDTDEDGEGDVCDDGCCDVAGDADGSGGVNIADVVFILNYIAGSDPPVCNDQADANGSNTVNIADAAYILEFIFNDGAAPVCGTTGL